MDLTVAVARKSRRLIPGEDPDVREFDRARRWLTIYEQREALLASNPAAAPQEVEDIAVGVSFWRDRVTELSGLDLDSDRRVMRLGGDRDVPLTNRELQLLEFLVQHPDRYFADHVLAVRAWGDRLSGDQVRIYVRRLRLKLDASGWELVSRRGYGYCLTRAPEHLNGNGHRDPASAEQVQRVLGRARALLQVERSQLDLAVSATNSELETIINDLRRRTDEVERLNAFMEGALTSLRVGVVAVDQDGIVTLWNTRSEDLWGLRAHETLGRPFGGLDLGLPVDQVTDMIDRARQAKNGAVAETILNALNRRGRQIRCRVRVMSLASVSDRASGAVVVVEELDRA